MDSHCWTGALREGLDGRNVPFSAPRENGPVWADFFRRYYPKYYGYSYDGGYVEEHPFGHPDIPGGNNHDCPHFVAVNGAGVEKEFPYQPGSP